MPTLLTIDVGSITSNQASSGGNIIDLGQSTISAKGVCWSTSPNPTIEDNITNQGASSTTGPFFSDISGLQENTTYYIRAYATNESGTAYGNEVSFTTLNENIELPMVITGTVQNITENQASIVNNTVSNNGNSGTILVRGIAYSTQPNPTIDNADGTFFGGNGIGSFDATLISLAPSTTYYAVAYATTSQGTAYGSIVSFSTESDSNEDDPDYPPGTVHCNGTPTAVVDVTNPITGKTWMDRNLGASQAATSSTDELAYGDLYQWGRGADGHQCRTSPTTSTLSSTDQPGHGSFILSNAGANWDWRSPQNTNLWQGVNGVNNPCPSGYRLPTEQELNAERQSWSSNNASGAYISTLKFTIAGGRNYSDGSLFPTNIYGRYWSSSYIGFRSRHLGFTNNNSNISNNFRADGFSVRCIKN